MARQHSTVQAQTLYIALAASLLAGFVLGVLYSSYKLPLIEGHAQQPPQTKQGVDPTGQLKARLQNNPRDSQAWVQLGHVYFESNQYVHAIEAYQQALKLLPNEPDIMTDLGIMYRRNGQPDKALAEFNKVIALASGHQQARFNKGVVLLWDMHDKAEALRVWKELLTLNPLALTPAGDPLSEMVEQLEQESQ